MAGARDSEVLWGSVATVLLLMGLAAVYALPGLLDAVPDCVLKAATGVPCPTCGSTRAAMSLAWGQPLAALAWNPLAGAGLLGLVLYLPYAWLVMAGAVRPLRTGWLTPPMPVALRWTIALLLALNWVYLLAAGR